MCIQNKYKTTIEGCVLFFKNISPLFLSMFVQYFEVYNKMQLYMFVQGVPEIIHQYVMGHPVGKISEED